MIENLLLPKNIGKILKSSLKLFTVICHVLTDRINTKSRHKCTLWLYLCAKHTAPTHRYWQRRIAIALG